MIQLRKGLSPDALTGLVTALRARFQGRSDQLSSLREMRGLGNVFSASLNPAAIRWLCENEQFDQLIEVVELDQLVSVQAA